MPLNLPLSTVCNVAEVTQFSAGGGRLPGVVHKSAISLPLRSNFQQILGPLRHLRYSRSNKTLPARIVWNGGLFMLSRPVRGDEEPHEAVLGPLCNHSPTRPFNSLAHTTALKTAQRLFTWLA